MTTETMREAVKNALRQHIKCDATGLAPAVAGVFLVGFEDAADAAIRTVLERLRDSRLTVQMEFAVTDESRPPAPVLDNIWQSMLDAAAREVG